MKSLFTCDAAIGRILAEDVTSSVDVPPHDNSAVDGYAVNFDDLVAEASTTLPVAGRAAAGHPLGRPARRGEAIRIFTGAPMPAGLDTVLMQEDCVEEAGSVTIPLGIKRGANRRAAGEDVTSGRVVLTRGTRLRPQEIGLAAAVGRSTLNVYQQVSAAVFSTGDEVGEPGGDLPPGKFTTRTDLPRSPRSNAWAVMLTISASCQTGRMKSPQPYVRRPNPMTSF